MMTYTTRVVTQTVVTQGVIYTYVVTHIITADLKVSDSILVKKIYRNNQTNTNL